MSIKIDKDIATLINGACKDYNLDKTEYINKLLWKAIRTEIIEKMIEDRD